MAAEAITANTVIEAIDKLLGLLDKKKSGEARAKAEREVNDKIIEITTDLLNMNILNAQLPPNSAEVLRLQKALELWKKFSDHFKKFKEHHDEGDDDDAKDELAQAKVYLKEFKEIMEKVYDEKKYLKRRQDEDGQNQNNKAQSKNKK